MAYTLSLDAVGNRDSRLATTRSSVTDAAAKKYAARGFAPVQEEEATTMTGGGEHPDYDSRYSKGEIGGGGGGRRGERGGPNQPVLRIETTLRQRDSGPYENVPSEEQTEWKPNNMFNGTDTVCSPTGMQREQNCNLQCFWLM